MKYLDLQEVKYIYNKGKNITQYLRKKLNQKNNTSKIIEIAYDLQAGSYIKYAKMNVEKTRLYTNEISQILDQNIDNNQSLLDVGTGELTTLVQLLNKIKKKPSKIFAFDISWSRLYKGKKFFEKKIQNKKTKLSIFCADMKSIPLESSTRTKWEQSIRFAERVI
jgi:ubiquinone/menaquinone biosynthesis C-methylase UbiE